ncbi:putative T7SS-secreted protein [Actinomycetospora flava]|uniref:T7SS-secreted protein n=1 Tax=Actinomycetospora flava TaxID=3129232 RepID=A0ABU8M606_9PSEU
MEAALGATTDPRELVGGDPAALTERAGRLRQFADHLGAAADGLERIDLRQWTGQAADAFRARFGETPRGWRDAATAFDRASRALGDFGGAVTLAQQRAGEAIDVHARAVAASEAARADYNRRVDAHNAAIAGGQVPPAMEPFTDPAAGDLARAEQILADARRGRDDAAARAAGEVRGAGELTAAPPSTIAQLGANVADTLGVAGTVEDRFTAGFGRGVEGLVQFGRTINPADPYNLTHPARAGANLSSTGAGLVRAVAHPTELVKGAVGTGWGSDPAGALGELVPNAALTAATGGGGAAGRLGRLARAAGRSENRPLERLATRADPVDVVSGAQLLAQVDLAIDAPLPLVLTRTHVSSWDLGRRFGPRWASTLDQRLEFVGGAVWFVREDAVVVVYPAPTGEEAVLPVAPDHAPRHPLRRDGEGWVLADPASGLRHTFAASGALTGWSVPGGDHVAVDRDDTGRPVAVRHSGGHHVEVVTDPMGLITGFRLDAPVVTFAHEDGQLAEVVNSSGRPLRFGYDAAGRMTSWTDRNGITYRCAYDERGRCVSGSADGGEMAWSFRYGRGVTESTDALGHTERFEYDARGRIVLAVDQLGAATRSVWGDGDRLLARTDPAGGTTRWVHDDAGRVVGVEHADGSAERVERDAVGNLVAATDAAGATVRWERDDAGRLVAATDPAGATTRWERDAAGHVVAVVDPLGARTLVENDAAGRPLAVTDPTGALTRVERDAFGRVVARTDPLGARTTYAWTVEGLLSGRTAPDGATWAREYDGEGNEVAARDPVGAVARREYGAFDVVTAVVAADGARTEIVRDPLRRVVRVRDAGGRTWSTVHDPAGRVVAETDYEGRTVTLERDVLGRVVRRRNASGQEVRWEYDAVGRVTTRWVDGAAERFVHDAAGRLVGATSDACSLRLERDAAGRVVAEDVDGRTVAVERDAAGRVVGRRAPSGATSRWSLDAVGRPAALDLGGQRMTFGVDAAGRETERSWGAASIASSWDDHDRLVGRRLSSPVGVTSRRTWTYRADDHLVGVADPAGSRHYDLDATGRVTAVRGPDGDETYRYDAAGTLVASGVGEPHVLDGTRVRRVGALVVRRDADGRVVLRQRRRLGARPLTWHFAWDALDRLVGVTTPDGARWRYRYDVLGRRVAKERLGAGGEVLEQVHVAWDGAVVAEETRTVAGSSTTTVWEWEPGTHRPLAQLTRTLTDDEVDERFHAIVTDLVGTPTELVGPDGEIAGSARASLWGRTVWTGASTPLRFPGQFHDDETGLAYNLHRYYDPETAQYASPDPLGLEPSPHPYNYVANPTAEIDPLGLQACPSQPHQGPLTQRDAEWMESARRFYRDTEWREVGRALQKHTGPNRPSLDHEVFGPWKPDSGGPKPFNAAGERLIREILLNPETQVTASYGRNAGVYQHLVLVGIPGGPAFRATLDGLFLGIMVWE